MVITWNFWRSRRCATVRPTLLAHPAWQLSHQAEGRAVVLIDGARRSDQIGWPTLPGNYLAKQRAALLS